MFSSFLPLTLPENRKGEIVSENLNINGYICANGKIYDILKSENVSKADLAKLDKNSDNKISEDDFAEFTGEEEEITYSKNPKIASLQYQQEREEEKIEKYQKRISDLMVLRNKTKVNIAGVSNEETVNSLTSKLDSIQSEIDGYNSKIIECISNLGAINVSIIQAQMQAANALSGTSASNGANASALNMAQGTASAGNTTSSLNVQTGSGSDLMAVTGDLSICLDRVASSLGTSRQGAADYITTLCNTVGKGYFDPKVILSQIFSESSGNQSCSTTATSDFVGLGQMSAVAVEEVNNQFGTNFTFNDMNDAAKNLKAMVYLMTYQYERYGHNLGAAITAYNVGHYSGTVNGYAQKILSRV